MLYDLDVQHPANYIHDINQQIEAMVESPRVDYCTWIDALHMAMPQFAQLGVINEAPAYFKKMYSIYNHTKRAEGGPGLWNPQNGFWYRDKRFIGQNVFWSRGNGWVMAAMVKVLQALPFMDPHRAEYVSTIQAMAPSLASAQQPDGFWYVNLGNSSNYPGPETSGTSFFVYGLAWAINNGILDVDNYGPFIAKAWNAMVKVAVMPNGFLGYVQGIGAGPSEGQPVTAQSTHDYGVGAFLLAGSELLKLCDYQL